MADLEVTRYANPMDVSGDSDEESNGQAAAVIVVEEEDESVEKDVVTDLEKAVEEEMLRRDTLLARNEGVVDGFDKTMITDADRTQSTVVKYFTVPVLSVLLLGVLIGISVEFSGVSANRSIGSIVGVVVLSTLSYMGCLFIIHAHFANPDIWSERRQQMMFSACAGLVHYFCLLFEVYTQGSNNDTDCEIALPLLAHAAFLAQMLWQVAVAHGVFRYIHFKAEPMSPLQKISRHACCWGVPIFIAGMLWFFDAVVVTKHDVFLTDLVGGRVLAPWCGVSGDPSVRGAKALFVHMPQLVGVVLYGFFYFYIALNLQESSTASKKIVSDLGDTRISASPHQILLTASNSKRQVDVTRAATNLRHTMAAFMMAYLLQTIVVVISEHFDTQGSTSASVAYYARIFLVTPQQLVYAFVFTSGSFRLCSRASVTDDEEAGAPTATIKNASEDGEVIAEVNTKANSVMLETQVKLADKSAAENELNITIKSKRRGSSRKFLRKLVQALVFMPVSLFSWIPTHIIRENFTRNLMTQMLLAITYVMVMLFPFLFFQGTRDKEEGDSSAVIVDIYLLLVLSTALFGVYRIRNTPDLLVSLVNLPSSARSKTPSLRYAETVAFDYSCCCNRLLATTAGRTAGPTTAYAGCLSGKLGSAPGSRTPAFLSSSCRCVKRDLVTICRTSHPYQPVRATQIPMLAFSAANLGTRYGTRTRPGELGDYFSSLDR